VWSLVVTLVFAEVTNKICVFDSVEGVVVTVVTLVTYFFRVYIIYTHTHTRTHIYIPYKKSHFK
jgi:hypothetical protein